MKKVFEFIESFSIAVLFITIAILFFFRIIVVEGDSMLPTLEGGDKLIISNFLYEPANGDIVVTDSHNSHKKPLIKRVIAIGGDTLRIDYSTGEVYLNGNVMQEDYIFETINPQPADDIDINVPDGFVFVMGDNRNYSMDSRSREIGLINEKDLLGKAVFRISPFSKIGKVK